MPKRNRNRGGRTAARSGQKRRPPAPKANLDDLLPQPGQAVAGDNGPADPEATVPQPPDRTQDGSATPAGPAAEYTADQLEQMLITLKSREAEVAHEQALLDERRSELEALDEELRTLRDRLERTEQEQAETSQRLTEESARLEKARLEARTGFLSELQQASELVRVEQDKSLQSLAEAEGAYLAAVNEQQNRFEQHLQSLTERTKAQSETQVALDEREARLEAKESAHRSKVDALDELITEATADLEERVASLQEELAGAREQRSTLRSRLLEAERAAEGVPVLQQRIASNEERIRELVAQLDRQPTGDVDPTVLADLRRRNSELDAELAGLRSRTYEWETRLSQGDRAQADLQLERDRAMSMKILVDGYRATIEDLQQKLGDLTDRQRTGEPFPHCSKLDREETLHRPPRESRSGTLVLDEFVDYLQAAMATAEEPRYYSLSSLRSFVAGLHASRLLVLQGLSGTGKTSLPLAFAQAIDVEAPVIEVASGWRDPQDLVGHYNAFERRFHETDLLKALYRSLLPGQAAYPTVVVLDEMNLSHPEHYLSDFLSALEITGESRGVPLRVPGDLAGLPAEITPDGKLPLGFNVWFVGTSNRDETTVSLADKTYDRAHVMELPRSYPNLAGKRSKKPPFRLPLTMTTLSTAFTEAETTHRDKAERVNTALQDLAEPLAELDIAWGNRLTKMVNSYVPVVVAARGTATEAADHLVTTKILRKAEGRYDLSEADIDHLERLLTDFWGELGGDEEQTAWRRLIERERRRKSRDA